MAVAAAHWTPDRQRFRIHRPPSDHFAFLAIDSGGFTAARRWGKYPWTVLQYVEFIETMSKDIPLTFCAVLDYACEPSVNRSIHQSNLDRIKATIENEQACREAAPHLPWLPVLQGYTWGEREKGLEMRAAANLPMAGLFGVGSVCGQAPRAASAVIGRYALAMPEAKFHGFGLSVLSVAHDSTFAALASWDSYAWNWAKAERIDLKKQPGETSTSYSWRLADRYLTKVIEPVLNRPRQLSLV